MEKYKKIYCEVFEIAEDEIEKLTYQSIDEWDSVGHMSLIATIEDEYNITLEMDDIIDWNSFETGIKILGKYGIDLS